MLTIVLISQHKELFQRLIAFLPLTSEFSKDAGSNQPKIDRFTLQLNAGRALECSYILATSSVDLKALVGDVNASEPEKYLIILDLRKPTPNWQALSEIKSLLSGHEYKILVMISSAQERSLVFQSGADDYLLFPLLPEETRSRIQTYALSLEPLSNQEYSTESPNLLERERLLTIGRLASTIAHDIGNSMQVIRGSLALATESPDDLQDVLEYVQLSYRESERVVNLITTLREVYRPQIEPIAPISVDRFLERLRTLTKHEMEKQAVEPSFSLPPQPAIIRGIANQLLLAFLSILLNMINTIGGMGGGQLNISVNEQNGMICFVFSANTPPAEDFTKTQATLDNFMVRNIISEHDGIISFSPHNKGFDLQISIPAWQMPT